MLAEIRLPREEVTELSLIGLTDTIGTLLGTNGSLYGIIG